ncbi:PREDICTED: uncharacterized protein LOC106314284 [Brassica oleracea var. oleracea]|uniref:uncharacterized protein LOC106314284 n=1 Tax=Brassica oleracea var. oleracea TaxID=109376 RepID=UPI0006A7145A|nr:PREDICTED: uncharacterized protein LOC106314284 [Brassica oleracea var. oleracea]
MATEEEADEYNISEVDWGEEPGYSWEDQNYGDGSEENDQCRESWTEDGHGEEPCRRELDSKPPDYYTSHTINKSYSKPWIKFTDTFYDNIPRDLTKTLVSFSGKENYSRWEEGMENYFWEYRVPEHKKLSIALDALVGEAYQWWLQEEKCRIHFKEPTPDWEYVKGLMYEHFEMKRIPPRACPKPLVKLKPKKLHEHKEEVKTLETIFSGKRTRKSTSSATPFQRNVDEGLGKEEPRPEAHQPEVYEQYTIETFSPADHALKMTKTKAESMQDAMSDNRVSIGTMEKNPAPNSKSYTQRVVNGETKSETGYFTKETTLLLRKNIDRLCRGDIASLLIKEKTPGGHCITKPSIYQDKLVFRTKPFEEGGNDEDLKSVAGPPAHKINHTSYIGASSDIGASKEGYLCDHEDFGRETTSYRFSTQPEHAANWFHTKRSSGLGDTPFTSQVAYTASELVLFKESNSLLKECATQTHV